MTENAWEAGIPGDDDDGRPQWQRDAQPGQAQQPARGLLWYRNIEAIIDEDSGLVDGLLSTTALAMIVGASGSTKTYVALHLALCIASGTPFFDKPVKQGGVVYVAAEAGESIRNRVVAWREAHPEIPRDIPFAAITWPVDFHGKLTANTLGEVASLIKSAIDGGTPVLEIIIDTMSRATPGADENSSQDMTSFIANMDILKALTGAAVTLVHHHGKDESRGARGHSSLYAAVDTEITVEYNKDAGIATAKITKQRDAATEGAFSYTLRPIQIGTRSDGRSVMNCVIEPVDAETAKASARAAKGPKIGKDARIGLELLRKAIDGAGQPPVTLDRFPPGALTVTVETWRRYFYTGTAKDDDPDPKRRGEAQRKQFQRARNDLQAAKVIDIWAEEVCILGSG